MVKFPEHGVKSMLGDHREADVHPVALQDWDFDGWYDGARKAR
jgi:hypothetical protein